MASKMQFVKEEEQNCWRWVPGKELTTDGDKGDGVSAASGMEKFCGACCLKSILLLILQSFRPILKVKAMKATVLVDDLSFFVLGSMSCI